MSKSAAELLHRVDRALTDYARADQVTRTVENLTSLEKQLSPHVEDLGQAVAAFDALDQVNQPVERPDTRAAVTSLPQDGRTGAPEQIGAAGPAPHAPAYH